MKDTTKQIAQYMGIINLSAFACIWLIYPLNNTTGTLLYSAQALLFAGLVGVIYGLIRLFKTPRKDTDPKKTADNLKRFNKAVTYQWLGIGAVIALLVVFKVPQFIPYVIMAVVGLHFIPMAKIFDVTLYYATTIAICLVALGGIALAILYPSELPHPLPFLATACVLIATAALQARQRVG